MKYIPDIVWVIGLIALIILCAGDPDLLGAIVHRVATCP